jgi:putative hydrolase of the HAD superfamily
LQGTACYPGAAAALRHVADSGLKQGLFADAQSFTVVQLQRGLAAQDSAASVESWLLGHDLSVLSFEVGARKPARRILRRVKETLAEHGVELSRVLHVGSRIEQDLVPARRMGMRTALFVGDREAVQATPEQLRDPVSRPDVLLTELGQIADVIG